MHLVFPNEIFLGEWINNKIHTENSAPGSGDPWHSQVKYAGSVIFTFLFWGGVSLVSAVLPSVSKLKKIRPWRAEKFPQTLGCRERLCPCHSKGYLWLNIPFLLITEVSTMALLRVPLTLQLYIIKCFCWQSLLWKAPKRTGLIPGLHKLGFMRQAQQLNALPRSLS